MASYHYNKSLAMSKLCEKTPLLLEVGGRGTGKTHQYACYAAKRKGCTLWIRRKTDELGYCVAGFMDYLVTDELVNKSKLNIGHMGKKTIVLQDGKEINVDCYYNGDNEEKIIFLPVSIAHKFKSAKLGNFDLIVYDEFISIVGDYVDDEEIALMEMISTMIRLNSCKVIMCANNGDPFNPVFMFFNINIDGREFQPIYNGLGAKVGWLHNIPINPEFKEKYEDSTIGRITAGTRYNDYALNNKSYNGVQMNIKPMPAKAVQKVHLVSRDFHLFIYKMPDSKEYIVSEKGDKHTMAYSNDQKLVNLAQKIVFDKDIMFMIRPTLLQGWMLAESEVAMAKLYKWLGI